MKKEEAIQIVKTTFDSAFDEVAFRRFTKDLLKDYIDKNFKPTVKTEFSTYIQEYTELGEYIDSENKKINILQVALVKDSSLIHARTAQRNFVAEYLKTRNLDAALVAFVSPTEEDWRFSLVKLEYSLENIEGKVKTKETLTPAKRWSFLVGRNEGSHTAQSRFLRLLSDTEKPNLKEIEESFNVEKVTDEFFEKYKDLYFKLKESLEALIDRDISLKKDFESKEIDPIDFAKKTLGQIVFLYFLQKKGWFGVESNKEWGDGSKRFIRELFKRKEKYGRNFFNDILEPLFYEALAQDRGKRAIYPKLNNTRMPFLNGGLFEPINDYDWQVTNINLPDSLFSNDTKTKEGDIGDGILDIFDRYNFTVNENEPLEKEVAVDPEMLGKVFENLLEIKERKDKGSFYTPREIVHYMCRESLINYLTTETNNEISQADFEILIYEGESIIENDTLAWKKTKKGKYKNQRYTLLMPQVIREKAEVLDGALKDIKIADPAVGSGAFPLGMINEIVNARRVLGIYISSTNSIYDLKLHAISNSIHGVDIDPGAVEIAKLRLWLSLVVEEAEPRPLPNLDHRIMQGNSLLSEYEGIKLFDSSFLENGDYKESEGAEHEKKLSDLQQEYFKLHKDNKLDPIKKRTIEDQIQNLQKRQKELRQPYTSREKNRSLFDTPQKYAVVKEKTEVLQRKIEQYISESRKTHKEELKILIDNLKWELIEESLKEQDKMDKLEEIKKLRHKNIKPFFLWKLEFSEVFRNKGGFDIVIGNPPYVSHDKIEGKASLSKAYSSYDPFADLYCYFIELGVKLGNSNGIEAYITSNSYLRANYGEAIRNYLVDKVVVDSIVNINESQIFKNAIVNSCISFYKKRDDLSSHKAWIVNSNMKDNSSFKNFVRTNGYFYSQDLFKRSKWTLVTPKWLDICKKIEGYKTLEELDTKIRLGLATGYNPAFIISEEQKDILISKNSKSSDLIKKTLRGKDINRYSYNQPHEYILLTKNGIDVQNDYPEVYKHLESFGSKFQKRGAKGKHWTNLRACAFFDDFAKSKIIWIELTNNGRFALASEEIYLLNSAYFLIPSVQVNIKYLLGLLNSNLMNFYMTATSQTSGMGTKRWIKDSVKNFPIKTDDIEKTRKIEYFVDQVLEITSKDSYKSKKPPIEQKEIEKNIDQMIYELYELTEMEIEIIEEGTK